MRQVGGSLGNQIHALGGARFGPHTKRDLVQLCKDLRTHVESKELATAEELAACWPPRRNASVYVWAYCWTQLTRFLERGRGAGSMQVAPEQVALEVLREQPVECKLPDRTVRVWPKSLECLLWFAAQDDLLAYLARCETDLLSEINSGALTRDVVAEPFDTLEKLARGRAEALRVVVAQACHPSVRYEPEPDVEPFRDISPTDLIRIYTSFVTVNGIRLIALRTISPHRTKPGQKKHPPMPWAVLVSTAADLWHVPDPNTLVAERSFASVLARLQLSAARAISDEVA